MYTISAKLTFHISHSDSLKYKRKIRRSLIEKTRHKFNVSISEVGTQDNHKTLTIGVAVVAGDASHARDSMEEIIRFMEIHTDAELISVELC
ncbi:MAG: DUF503 domain-containing protein [Defluviitaleaceae bacterium]|nr:DUF503 domain-containing protein [Defluviitaleaceae bacterium]